MHGGDPGGLRSHAPGLAHTVVLTAPAESKDLEESGTGSLKTSELELGGMHCSACATRIERTLGRLPAVVSASVNLATTRAFITYDEKNLDLDDVCRAVADIGYTAQSVDAGNGRIVAEESDHWVLRSLLAAPLALAALLISLLAPETQAAGWSVLVLAVVVEGAGGWPFLRNAARQIRHGATSMDTLIAVGTLAAVAVNGVEVIALGGRHIHLGSGSGAFASRLHFAMAPVIVALLASGRAIEASTRRRASQAMHSLLALRPPVARVVRDEADETGELVAPESIPLGALIRVRANESIPLDGSVVAGWSAVDESMLTGEPLPVDRGRGSPVIGGTRNGEGALVIRVGALASESVLARLQRLVEEAQRDKAPLQRVADRISTVFVPAVLLGALTTFLIWWFVVGDFGKAVLSGVAVLLVACPCAMGLAAPMAMMVGCGRAAALGIFVRSGDTLERLARVDTVAFDKTGTLTERNAVVVDVIALDLAEDEVLRLAAAVEVESEHPIASALVAAAGPSTPRATEIRVIPGVGVAGLVEGQTVTVSRLEQSSLPRALNDRISSRYRSGETLVVVTRAGEIVGAIALTTPLRAEAAPSVQQLHELGLQTVILSGDSEPAVRSVATELGIDDALSALSPAGKVEALGARRDDGRRVLMVGDGVNDAPALAAADVGCSIGSGSQAALANSEVALLGNDLYGVPAAINVARATYAVVLQNFGWAMGYNIAALPLAAAGLIDPLVAAVAMGLSSLLVVANSLRLTRLGRSGLAKVQAPRLLRGARGIAFSIALPVVIFATITVVGQVISPARGQSLLPQLPSITTIALGGGASAQAYLDPGAPGVNELHVFVYPPAATSIVSVMATAELGRGRPEVLRHLRIASNHYVNYVVLTPGDWAFHVVVVLGGRTDSFSITRTIS